MEVSVVVPKDPVFAAEFVNTVVAVLDTVNQQIHARRAREQRVFIEIQENDSRLELNRSEKLLADFVEKNRLYSSSPQLAVEYKRLSRNVEANSAIWMELRKQLEMAKIEEHKNLVSVTVLAGKQPTHRYSPRLSLNVLLAVVLAGFMCALVLMIRGQIETSRT